MKILKNKIVQFALVLVAGIAIGALFYPTKHIEERIEKEHQEVISTMRTAHETTVSELSEKLDKEKTEKTELTIETSRKITKLTYQVKDLQSKKKETWYKIIKPDGTIEEKRYSESEVNESTKVVTSIREEFDRKITEISDRWQRVHKTRVTKLKKDFDLKETEYKKTIDKMKSEKIVDINPKTYGLEIGYLSSSEYYMHGNIDVFGPIFIGVHTSTNFGDEYAVGAGVGIRF